MWTNNIINITNWRVACLLLFLAITSFPQFSRAHQENNEYLLRRRDLDAGVNDDPSGNDPPKITDCLLSASSSADCGSVVGECVWCAEPVYGLCVTETAARRMNIMPFFSCSMETSS